jgi:hypothetical protein
MAAVVTRTHRIVTCIFTLPVLYGYSPDDIEAFRIASALMLFPPKAYMLLYSFPYAPRALPFTLNFSVQSTLYHKYSNFIGESVELKIMHALLFAPL